MKKPTAACRHPVMHRRVAIQAGTVGLLGLGMNHLSALRAEPAPAERPARACIFIFLSGGLAQHDSFDMKPEASEEIRGEFEVEKVLIHNLDEDEEYKLFVDAVVIIE